MSRVTPIIQEDARTVVAELASSLVPLAGTSLLVTGAGGFLCSYFLDVITTFNDSSGAEPCRIVAVDNFRTGIPDRTGHLVERSDVRFVQHDVSTPLELDQCPEWIIHGASVASPTFYRRFPLETIDVNVNGTRHLLELSRKGARGMLYLSTSEVYGDPEPTAIPTPEHYRGYVSCTGPRACYDESKRLAETLCAVYHRVYGTAVKVVRPFNVYGPGQRLDDRRIMPDLMAASLRGGPLVLYGDGRATRAFCYARDAIRAMLLVLVHGAGGEAYNVGNDSEELTMAELGARMAKVAGDPPLRVEYHVSADAHYLTDNPQRRCPDLTKLRALGGWQPAVGLTEGLSRTLSSYRMLAPHEVLG